MGCHGCPDQGITPEYPPPSLLSFVTKYVFSPNMFFHQTLKPGGVCLVAWYRSPAFPIENACNGPLRTILRDTPGAALAEIRGWGWIRWNGVRNVSQNPESLNIQIPKYPDIKICQYPIINQHNLHPTFSPPHHDFTFRAGYQASDIGYPVLGCISTPRKSEYPNP